MSKQSLLSTIRMLGKDIDVVEIARATILHVINVDDAYTCQKKFKDLIEEAYALEKEREEEARQEIAKRILADGVELVKKRRKKKEVASRENEMSAQKFRLVLADMAYIHLNLKFFALNVLKRKVTPDNCRHFATLFEIELCDAKLLYKIFTTRGFKSVGVRVRLAEVNTNEITSEAFMRVFEMFKRIYPDIMKHIRYKTYSKLRFLTLSSNIEFYDLHMELICKALQTYIKMVPTQRSELHIANIIRTTLNNHTINMIKTHTTQKRARLVKSGVDGFGIQSFDLVTISENQLFKAFGFEDGEMAYEDLRNSTVNYDEENARDTALNFSSVLKRYGTNLKRKTLLQLVACQEHAKFTNYLRKTGDIEKDEDNVDFNDAVGDEKYFEHVCQFLEVCEVKAKRFIKRIGKAAYPEIAKQWEETTNAE